MAIFENPNTPRQPQKGVYIWYAKKGNKRLVIYVGQAGNKDTCLKKGTLFRGVSELQRATFSQDYVLDTDFIVGTAIKYLNKHGYECAWKHINDHPEKEMMLIINQKPLLQEVNGKIKQILRAKKEDKNYWKLKGLDKFSKNQKVKEAEQEIIKELKNMLKIRGSG
jgi:hypothetical protein